MFNSNKENKLQILKLRENAVLPKRATDGSAGFDIYANISEELVIGAGETAVIPTGFAVKLPLNTAGMIYTRSGLGIKHGIVVKNGVGVIDWDYRGEVHVGLLNVSDKPYAIQPNERIAQLVVTPVVIPELCCVESLDETDRGDGGFGSTGKG